MQSIYPPRFPNASCAFAQGQTGASPALLGSPKPSRISGCYLHGKKPIQCDSGVDLGGGHFRFRTKEGKRLFSLDMGVLAPLTPQLPRAGTHPALSPRKEIFLVRFLQDHSVPLLLQPTVALQGAKTRSCLQLPMGLGTRALLSPSWHVALPARGIPGCIVSPTYCKNKIKKGKKQCFPQISLAA